MRVNKSSLTCRLILSDADDEPSDIFTETANEYLFLKNVALFYLKLQAKLLLPSSGIQTIMGYFQEVHDKPVTFAFQIERGNDLCRFLSYVLFVNEG